MEDQDRIGGPALDRQERSLPLGPDGRPLVPQRVPEARPTPLTGVFIYLSIVVLICGVITIIALELGTPFSSLWVKIPVLVGTPFLLAVSLDAIVRIWRSAFAWLPVDRGRGLFRFVWVAVLVGALLGFLVFAWLVLSA